MKYFKNYQNATQRCKVSKAVGKRVDRLAGWQVCYKATICKGHDICKVQLKHNKMRYAYIKIYTYINIYMW